MGHGERECCVYVATGVSVTRAFRLQKEKIGKVVQHEPELRHEVHETSHHARHGPQNCGSNPEFAKDRPQTGSSEIRTRVVDAICKQKPVTARHR